MAGCQTEGKGGKESGEDGREVGRERGEDGREVGRERGRETQGGGGAA